MASAPSRDGKVPVIGPVKGPGKESGLHAQKNGPQSE